ncbi:MAG: PepSY domain-containing protein [Planctomycetota bacterium JB042]
MKRSTLVLLLGAAAIAALVWPAFAVSTAAGPKAARAAKLLAGKTFSIPKAIEAAERRTGGRAIEAEIEIEDGKVVVEIEVLVTEGDVKLLEVEVDGETNEILEIEDEDAEEEDDDDDDGDDGEDGDDGDDDLR